MKNINWNELTPACYAIANANDVDVGVGGSMVHNNIRHGRAVDIGAENLPAAFRPDWAALGDGVDLAAENDEFNAWIRKRQGNVKALAALWNAKDYQGMIELMVTPPTPAPSTARSPATMSKYIAVITRADITRAALVEAGGRSMEQVKAACGCQYILNSWFYDTITGRPVGNLKIDGTVKAGNMRRKALRSYGR